MLLKTSNFNVRSFSCLPGNQRNNSVHSKFALTKLQPLVNICSTQLKITLSPAIKMASLRL